MALIRPKINNIKISIKFFEFSQVKLNIKDFLASKCKYLSKRDNLNFVIFRPPNGFVYTIFHSGHINITNLKSVDEIHQAVCFIVDTLNLPQTLNEAYQIDNISANGTLHLVSKFNSLQKLCEKIQELDESFEVSKISYETQRFSGATIRRSGYFKKNVKGNGTVLLFNNSKFIIVGAKSLDHVKQIHDWLEIVTYHADKSCKL